MTYTKPPVPHAGCKGGEGGEEGAGVPMSSSF